MPELELPIYMDNMATTPVDPRVLDALLPYYQERFGNAASRDHAFGREARDAVETARARIANLIRCDPGEIVFTSGATESDNLALKGVIEVAGPTKNQVITAPIEHKAILDSCKWLKSRGCEIVFLQVDRNGLVDPEDLRKAISARTAVISIMLVNNEIGVLQPIRELANIAREHDVLFHTDAAQAVGKIEIDTREPGIDLMSLTAHKIYGPKGIGALYLRRETARGRVAEQMHGGGHEGQMRSGTLNVAGCVAFGEACRLAGEEINEERARLARLRDRLQTALQRELPAAHVNGHPSSRVPGNLNMRFTGVDGEALLTGLHDVALSLGAACNSGAIEPSYVLKAIGLTNDDARGSVRFGLGRFNTEAEVDYTAGRVIEEVKRLRELSPRWDDAVKG